MSHSIRSSNKQRTITQVGDKEYIIEGTSGYGKLGFEVDPSVLTDLDFESGPFLHIGDSFLGLGKIVEINNIDSGKDDYLMVKITVE